RNSGFFDAQTLTGIQIPMLFVAGSVDDVSLYEGGTRSIWEEAVNVDRALLTFENANHNAAAPYPAPAESFAFNERLGFAPFEHYADAVWDTTRMNNIAQHFSTAWLDLYLKQDASKDSFLDLIPIANDGVFSVDDDGNFTEDHTHWQGFADRTAKGLMFEWLRASDSAE
ncbi:dienelactone hydrolase, partial [bacterium]|nr:dienelactone hydrolase [bacterium]